MANTIAKGNCTTIRLTDGGSNIVNIAVTKLDENFDKKLINYDIPRPKDSRDQGPKKNIIDLLQVKRVITINGVLTDYTYSSDGGTTYDTAIQQRDKLRNLILAGTNCTLYIRGDTSGTYSIGDGNTGNTTSVNFLKVMITSQPEDDIAGDPSGSPPTHYHSPSRFIVTLSLLLGTGVMD